MILPRLRTVASRLRVLWLLPSCECSRVVSSPLFHCLTIHRWCATTISSSPTLSFGTSTIMGSKLIRQMKCSQHQQCSLSRDFLPPPLSHPLLAIHRLRRRLRLPRSRPPCRARAQRRKQSPGQLPRHHRLLQRQPFHPRQPCLRP